MLTQNSERQTRCIWEMSKSWKRCIMNKIIVFESPRFCPTKAKSRLFQKTPLCGPFSKALVLGARFWYPIIYSWRLKWRKKSPDTCGQGLNICYETKSRNLKCYISFTSIENEGRLLKRSSAYVWQNRVLSDFQLPNAFMLTPFSWTVSRKQTA